MCAKCTHEGECLKGTNKKCDCFMDDNNYYDDKKDYEEDCKKEEEKDCNCSKKQQY